MQTIIDNIIINYELLGSKNTNNILFLHGWKNSLKNWESVAQSFSATNKVILLDLPGFGNSSLPKSAFDTYDYANIVSQFITKLNLKQVTLLGHSFGGKIGIVLASKNNSISKLVLVDPSGIPERSFLTSTKIAISKILKPLLHILPRSLKDKVYSLLSSKDYQNAGNLLESFKKIVVQDMTVDAQNIKIPTLIVWGENDKEVSPRSAKKLKNLIPKSTLRIIWRAGHHPHLDKPEKFIEILKEFI